MNFAYTLKRWLRPSWRSRPSDARHRLGARGEAAAARFLKHHGHRILDRNYRCAFGEIDLISIEGETIVFVEVKTRSDDVHADPQDAVGAAKRSRLERAARHFLKTYRSGDHPCRFDIITVIWRPGKSPSIDHIPDAFQARRT